MSKSNRLSVTISTSLERQLRQLSAENGRSLAANFAEMAQRGTVATFPSETGFGVRRPGRGCLPNTVMVMPL